MGEVIEPEHVRVVVGAIFVIALRDVVFDRGAEGILEQFSHDVFEVRTD